MKNVLIIAVLAFNAVCMSYLAFSENKQPFNLGYAVAGDENSDDTVKALNKDVTVTESETSTCNECAGTVVTTQSARQRTCPTPHENMSCKPETKIDDPTVEGHAESCSQSS